VSLRGTSSAASLGGRALAAAFAGARLVAVAAVVAGGVGCRLDTAQAPVAEQARAPDFVLPAHDGRTVSLAELVAGGPAIVVFYRGHW
jgi:cytochrome oxidase Cu insertion factor (SCO1/SenC/PrrC family)